jgi:hypothetical protein
VVPAQQVVDGDDAALAAVTAPDFDPRAVAVTEEPVEGLPESGAGGGQAEIVDYEPERVVIRASSQGPGLLVLSDNWYPGWKAKVDGEPVDVERVDYLLRGVPLAGGSHTVELTYEPLSWRVGWIVTLLALVGLVAAVGVGLRRRRDAPA